MDMSATASAAFEEMVSECACTNFRKASRAVTMLFDETLAPCGLRSTQLAILVAIGLGEPSSLARLARELVMDSSTLARNLKPLEQRGLIAKTAVGDRRRRAIALTAEGQAVVDRALPLWAEAQRRFVGQFGAERWPQLRSDLIGTVEAARALG
jgi:DNA-binding MarR family transcriptional regulator